jgi:hypothetical protein
MMVPDWKGRESFVRNWKFNVRIFSCIIYNYRDLARYMINCWIALLLPEVSVLDRRTRYHGL